MYKTIMARKDVENLLRNLYCFLEILQTSRSDEVSSWDRQSLDNALKWAAFAEQVYTQSKNKPYCHQLDAELQKLGQLHWRLGDYTVNLTSLKQSKEKLMSNLLQNTYLNSELKKFLLCDLRHLRYSSVTEVCSHLTSTQALVDVLMTSELTSPSDRSQDAVELSRETEARRLCQLLTHSFRHGSRGNAYINEKLKMFASCEDGINVIASALNIASSSLNNGSITSRPVCDVLLQFFLKQVEASEDLLWSVSPSLMTHLCCQSSDLFDHYLQCLTRCGDDLQPDYDSFVVRGRRLKHDWKLGSQARHSLTYGDLQERLLHLVNSDCRHIALATKMQVQTLADLCTEEPSLWKDMLCDLETAVCSH